jgi:DnaJ-class molecular chaperone
MGWMQCITCHGTGNRAHLLPQERPTDPWYRFEPCPDCRGTGRQMVAVRQEGAQRMSSRLAVQRRLAPVHIACDSRAVYERGQPLLTGDTRSASKPWSAVRPD